ncbi:hypothetical protein PRIPAC_72449, partial [Pristionchus pacificus]
RIYFQTSQRPIDPSDSAIVEDTVSCLDESIETSQCPIDSSDSAIVESAVSRLDESIETSQPPIDSSDSAIVEDTVSCLIDRIEMMESECGTSKDTADVICTKAAGGERSGSVVSIDSDLEIVLVTRRVARGRGVQKWNTGKNGWMPEDALGWRRCGLIPFGNSEEIEMEGERENRPGGLRRSPSVLSRGHSPPPPEEACAVRERPMEVSTGPSRGSFSPRGRWSPRGGRGGGRGGWQRSPGGDCSRTDRGEGGMDRGRERSRERSMQRPGGDSNIQRPRTPIGGPKNGQQRREDGYAGDRSRSPFRGRSEQRAGGDFDRERCRSFSRDRLDNNRRESDVNLHRSRSPSRDRSNNDHRRNGDNYNRERSRSRSRGYNNNDQRRNGDNYRRDRSRSRSRGYNNNDHG